jgi:hypothetical protein
MIGKTSKLKKKSVLDLADFLKEKGNKGVVELVPKKEKEFKSLFDFEKWEKIGKQEEALFEEQPELLELGIKAGEKIEGEDEDDDDDLFGGFLPGKKSDCSKLKTEAECKQNTKCAFVKTKTGKEYCRDSKQKKVQFAQSPVKTPPKVSKSPMKPPAVTAQIISPSKYDSNLPTWPQVLQETRYTQICLL